MAIVKCEYASEISRGFSGSADSMAIAYVVELSPLVDDPEDAREQILTHILTGSASPGVLKPPLTLDGGAFSLGNFDIDQVSPGFYNVDLKYSQPTGGSVSSAPPAGVVTDYSFHVGTETTQVRVALNQERMPMHPGTDKIGDLINVSPDGEVRGEQATRAIGRMGLAFKAPFTFFTAAYLEKAEKLVNHVNQQRIQIQGRTYEIGELRLLDFNADVTSEGDSSVSFAFGYRQNIPEVADAGPPEVKTKIAGIEITRDLYGWERYWVQYEQDIDDDEGDLVANAKAIYVYRDNWELKNFADLAIPGATYP
ncbi:MAG: hypothetical protein ACPGLY_27430 [Rubripirellula sp.]